MKEGRKINKQHEDKSGGVYHFMCLFVLVLCYQNMYAIATAITVTRVADGTTREDVDNVPGA